MLYAKALTIPASTTEANPTTLKLKLTYGIIHRVELEFPPGCAGLAHLAIDQGEHQVWPTNPESAFSSDNHVIAWNEYQEIFSAPYTLRLRGWNEDDTFPHTIVVRIGILHPKALGIQMQKQGILSRLKGTFGLEGLE